MPVVDRHIFRFQAADTGELITIDLATVYAWRFATKHAPATGYGKLHILPKGSQRKWVTAWAAVEVLSPFREAMRAARAVRPPR